MKSKKNEPFEEFLNNLFGSSLFNLRSSDLYRELFFLKEDENSFPEEGDANFNKTEEITENETHSIKREVWTSLDGTQSFQRNTSKSKKTADSLSREKLKELRDAAVSEHRYEDAAKYRDQLLNFDRRK